MSQGESAPQDVVVDEEARRKAEEFVEQEEGVVRRFGGRTEILVAAATVAMSLYHLYAAYAIIPAHILRATHVGFLLFLVFLLFPATKRQRARIQWHDVVLSLLGVAVIAYLLLDFDEFIERAVTPTRWDLFFGVSLVLLVLPRAVSRVPVLVRQPPRPHLHPAEPAAPAGEELGGHLLEVARGRLEGLLEGGGDLLVGAADQRPQLADRLLQVLPLVG